MRTSGGPTLTYHVVIDLRQLETSHNYLPTDYLSLSLTKTSTLTLILT